MEGAECPPDGSGIDQVTAERIGEGAGAALVGCIYVGTIAKDIGLGERKGSAGRLLFETNQKRLGRSGTGRHAGG